VTLPGGSPWRSVPASRRTRVVPNCHRLLSQIAEDTADAVLVAGSAGNIEWFNAAFEQMTGFTRAEVLGKIPGLLKSGQDPVGPARILSDVNALLVLPTDGVTEAEAADGGMCGACWALDVVRVE
jgi:PAS domain-containing protein